MKVIFIDKDKSACEELSQAIKKLRPDAQITLRTGDNGDTDCSRIIIETQSSYIPVRISEITLAESDFKTCFIYTASGAKYPLGMSLKKLEEFLGEKEFVRASRQWLVRLDMIESIEKSFIAKSNIILKDGIGPGKIEISNDKLKTILSSLA